MLEEIKEHFGFMLEEDLLKEISEFGVLKSINENDTIIEPGAYIKSMPLLLEGAIKVSRVDDKGDELLLYFIESGDTCAMSLNCCLSNSKSEIKATAETPVRMIMIPVSKMDEWLVKYKSWRSFIMNSFQARLQEVLQTVDNIAFLNMDERLMQYLQDKTKITHSTKIQTTHEEIAKDLHTSRVVISRLLKKLEHSGDVVLHRNAIDVINL
jgi:CRP/FNR family transcriptional regulator, anaerobic regulatory protein